jgi:hypothetical protein
VGASDVNIPMVVARVHRVRLCFVWPTAEAGVVATTLDVASMLDAVDCARLMAPTQEFERTLMPWIE